MELKGLAKYGRAAAVAAASFGLVLGAAPMASAQTETWEMPDVDEALLQDAVDSVIEAAGEENVQFNLVDSTFNQVVYNYTNWVVCGQSPRAETEVPINPERPRSVTLALNRPSVGC